MLHPVSEEDLHNMRYAVSTLSGRLTSWSELIGTIKNSGYYIPPFRNPDNDYKGYNAQAKKMTEERLKDAISRAKKMQLTAAMLVPALEDVLDMSYACEAYDPNPPPPPKTWFAPSEHTDTPENRIDNRFIRNDTSKNALAELKKIIGDGDIN
jgi:hypothetical protein